MQWYQNFLGVRNRCIPEQGIELWQTLLEEMITSSFDAFSDNILQISVEEMNKRE